MAQYGVIIGFAFIFMSEILRNQVVLAIGVHPKNTILNVYNEYRNTTVIIPTSAEEEIQSVNIAEPIIFIIHGWLASANSSWVPKMANLLLRKRPCNAITVDWSSISSSINYPVVRLEIEQVGNLVGDFIVNITKNNIQNLAKIHLIGHSLGAHVSGYAGQRVYAKTKQKVARITGLDAAGPLFGHLLPDSQQLSKDDAVRVDAIHTDAGLAGRRHSYGTSDFFPNGGGPFQPGCTTIDCSHERSHEFYSESIMSNRFIAVQCSSNSSYQSGSCNSNSKTIMGDDEPPTAAGNYYLSTNANPPYAKGFSFP